MAVDNLNRFGEFSKDSTKKKKHYREDNTKRYVFIAVDGVAFIKSQREIDRYNARKNKGDN